MEPHNEVLLDLACGIGGFTAAARSLGHPVAAAVDTNAQILQTYAALWGRGGVLQADVCSPATIRALRRRRAAVACMGFPCQPFSRAGDQQGLRDERADLYRLLPELHALLRPWGWILENVANFATLDGGRFAADLRGAFQDMGMR
eukprot:1707208-Prorocentrum_lima.AAC.1